MFKKKYKINWENKKQVLNYFNKVSNYLINNNLVKDQASQFNCWFSHNHKKVKCGDGIFQTLYLKNGLRISTHRKTNTAYSLDNGIIINIIDVNKGLKHTIKRIKKRL